jgi:hypothetical protein
MMDDRLVGGRNRTMQCGNRAGREKNNSEQQRQQQQEDGSQKEKAPIPVRIIRGAS